MGESSFNFCSTMAGDHDHIAGLQGTGGVYYMGQQSAPSQRMQHFGQLAFHAGAFARRHDDYIDFCHVLLLFS
jgi:hypothetical protein